MNHEFAADIQDAARAIVEADALIIGAGAGMGVDSGLPDFRGDQGFWKAYPPYANFGLHFTAIANPRWFRDDPALAWGFYGHRMHLYRKTRPHRGFAILRRWAELMPLGAYIYTSNVDGHFQRAGFDPERIVEVHGTIHRMQCTDECGIGIFPAEPYSVEIDLASMRAVEPLPQCLRCEALARPNILMFGDRDWDSVETQGQSFRFKKWLAKIRGSRVVVVECGAGTAVPTVRLVCEDLSEMLDALLIRINPREPEIPDGHIAIPLSSKHALTAINQLFEPDHENDQDIDG